MGYRYEIIVAVINLGFYIIVGMNFAYSKPITVNFVFMVIVRCIVAFIVFTLWNMLLIKIGEVNRRIKEATA